VRIISSASSKASRESTAERFGDTASPSLARRSVSDSDITSAVRCLAEKPGRKFSGRLQIRIVNHGED